MLQLGKAIRIVREAKEMRLGALAERSGVSVPFLSLVESGAREPSLGVLRKLAMALDIPAEVLILIAQPTSGQLQSGDDSSQSLVVAIQKLMDVEGELRLKLGTETRTRATRRRNN